MAKRFIKEYDMNPDEYDFRKVQYKNPIKFKNFKIEFVQTTHSVPLSAAIVVYTKDELLSFMLAIPLIKMLVSILKQTSKN